MWMVSYMACVVHLVNNVFWNEEGGGGEEKKRKNYLRKKTCIFFKILHFDFTSH